MAQNPAVEVSPDPFQMKAYALYRALWRSARIALFVEPGKERGLGGVLFYAGELDADGRALVVAANVAGCATLAATAGIERQQHLIRDGVIDFLVNSLDEALRILKNEIRRRTTVGVCVALAPEAVEQEMLERGVQPDFMAERPDGTREVSDFGAGSRVLQFNEPDPNLAWITWRVAEAPARWMPKLDAIALDCLPAGSWERRWIRLSSRYLGRGAIRQSTVYCEPESAREIIRRIADSVRRQEIGAEVVVSLASEDETFVSRMVPGSNGTGS